MNDLSKLIEDIASDLWHRFRAIVLAIDQAQRFVAILPGAESESLNEKELWLGNLPNHPEEINEIAKELVLRVFRTALEPTNYVILQKLIKETWVPFSDIMQVTGLNILSVSERVNDLIQAGLAVKDVQTGQVQATQAAQRVIEVFQEMQGGLSKTILEKFGDRSIIDSIPLRQTAQKPTSSRVNMMQSASGL